MRQERLIYSEGARRIISPMLSSKRILGDNIKAMIDKDAVSVRAWALSHKLDQKKVDRLVKAETAVSLDTLDEIAAAVGLQPWQLLVVKLDPAHPPRIAVTETEVLLYERLRKLVKAES